MGLFQSGGNELKSTKVLFVLRCCCFSMRCSNHNTTTVELSFGPPGSRRPGRSGIRYRETRKTFLGDTELSGTVSNSLRSRILTELEVQTGPYILLLSFLFICLINCQILGSHCVPLGLKHMPIRNQFLRKFLLFFLLTAAILLAPTGSGFSLPSPQTGRWR